MRSFLKIAVIILFYENLFCFVSFLQFSFFLFTEDRRIVSNDNNDVNKVGTKMKLGDSLLSDALFFTLCNLIRSPCLYLDEVLDK